MVESLMSGNLNPSGQSWTPLRGWGQCIDNSMNRLLASEKKTSQKQIEVSIKDKELMRDICDVRLFLAFTVVSNQNESFSSK